MGEARTRTIDELEKELAAKDREIQALAGALRVERAGRMRDQGNALERFAGYDAQLALLRKEAAKAFLAQADALDPPKGPSKEPTPAG